MIVRYVPYTCSSVLYAPISPIRRSTIRVLQQEVSVATEFQLQQVDDSIRGCGFPGLLGYRKSFVHHHVVSK